MRRTAAGADSHPLRSLPPFEIDDADASDAPALEALERASPEQGRIRLAVDFVSDYFSIDRALPGMHALVARSDERVVGTVSYRLSRVHLRDGEGTAAYLSRMRVHPSCRQRGIATALLRAACKRAADAGAQVSWGAVVEDNAPALAACRAAGMLPIRQVGVRVFPVQWLARLPTARHWAARLHRVEHGDTVSSCHDQLAPLDPLARGIPLWAIRDPGTGAIAAWASVLDVSAHWRLCVTLAPPLVLLAAGLLARADILPHFESGLRTALVGSLSIPSGSAQAGAGLIEGLSYQSTGVDLLILVADGATPGWGAARRLPGLRSQLTLVASPAAILDPILPVAAFPL